MVVLLDFKKAYDTLDRSYMLQVLRAFGFPKLLVLLRAALRHKPTDRFRVNGFLLVLIQVTRGVKQGFPFGEDGEQRIAGFANDIVVYMEDVGQIPHMVLLLVQFATRSGLEANTKKTVVVGLGKTRLAVLAAARTTRHLGVRVGLGELGRPNWDHVQDALRVRLRLATTKTLTVNTPKMCTCGPGHLSQWRTAHTLTRLSHRPQVKMAGLPQC